MFKVLRQFFYCGSVKEVLGSIGKYWEGLGENIAAFTVSNTV